MKIKNKILLFIAVIWGAFGCDNQEVSFDDFDYTAVYFPFQTPLRTLVLGEDRIDNSLDNELKFNVGVSIGGLYTNNQDWSVSVDYAFDLAEGLNTVNGDTIMVLPVEMIANVNPALPGTTTIPAGDFNGTFEFQLQDAFLDDPIAYTGQYVIPLRITGTNADSILTGFPIVPNPDKRVDSDWDVAAPPKDYTLFGVKFINPYHGAYLHRGVAIEKDADGAEVNRVVYRSNFIVQNEIWKLLTRGRNEVVTTGVAQNNGEGFSMKLIVNGNSVTIEPDESSGIAASGSGTFVPSSSSSEVWGDQSRNAFYLSYTYDKGNNTVEVRDTLVLRDRDVVFEEYEVVPVN